MIQKKYIYIKRPKPLRGHGTNSLRLGMQRPGPGAGLRKGLGEMKNKKTKKKEKKVNNRRPSRRNLIYQKRVALKLVALGQKAKSKMEKQYESKCNYGISRSNCIALKKVLQKKNKKLMRTEKKSWVPFE